MGHTLKCPRGRPGEEPIELDLDAFAQAERLEDELGRINSENGQYLLPIFGKAYTQTSKALGRVNLELARAKDYRDKVGGSIRLGRAAEVIKEKGAATTRSPGGSADQREAVVDQDPEYLEAKEKCNKLQYLAAILEPSMIKMIVHYKTVRGIVERSQVVAARQGNSDLNTELGGSSPLLDLVERQTGQPPDPEFGEPRYS